MSSPTRLDAALGAGGEATAKLIGRASSAHTHAAYAGALQRLGAWLGGRRLDDRNLAAYLRTLQAAGRAPATAALVVSAVRRAARGAGERAPDGPLTQQALEDFRRRAAATRSPQPDARTHRRRVRRRPGHLLLPAQRRQPGRE